MKESSNTNISQLYRGQVISKDELDRIRSSIGEFISINSFLSTTRSQKKALQFAISTQCDNLERILFKIKVGSRIKAKPFADISRLSYFPGEEEILLMLGSIFRLESVHYEDDQQIWMADLDLCDEDDHDLKQVFDHMKKEMGSETTLISLGNLLLDLGELEKAEKYYNRLLNELTVGDPGIPGCYIGLGAVHQNKGEYDLALMNHEKALKIQLKALPPDHPDIASTYNNMGAVHQNKGEYDLALMNHEKALKIQLKALPLDHPDIASTYYNMGNVQDDKGEYDLALMNHEKALKIQLKALPPDHPDIASTYRNMGLAHEAARTWQSALECHNRAAAIRRKSLPTTHPQLVTTESDIRRVKAQLK
ncbi:unnamed protein product [Didymodactylos carnosus]|uniref:Kinesin light chain n=1 Tax=Didymodactylos carnosus TaxID=1234261 RepID=A0A8S2X3M8_9BILA|nr:unnamed protein product [Didymodactylos carnosus]